MRPCNQKRVKQQSSKSLQSAISFLEMGIDGRVGGGGGEGGTKTQRRMKETGWGVVQCATEETTGNGQIRNKKIK
jgi:hypothetical protein